VYDGLARLVNRSETRPTGTRVSSFAYIGASDRPRTEDQRDGSGSLQKTKAFLYSGGRLAGIAVTPTGAGTTNYAYDSDPAGDVSQLVDDGGAARASYAYDPYGASDAALSRGDVDPEDPTNPFRYGAKAFDSGSQTLDMGARRFDADTARFVQRDSFTDASADLDLGLDETGSNRYALAAGNPIGLGELDGHLTYRRFLNGIRLTPLQRRQMFAHFFRVFRGTKSHYRWDWGFGRGLGQFLGWEIASGRIRPGGQGSQWWKGVNGWMAQDLRDAQRLLKRGKRRSAVRDVNLWMKYGIESHRGRTTRSRQQAALWNAHQHSVHCGIAFGSGVYVGEPHSEQDFIRYAIKAVDLAAIAQRPTDSDEIVFPVSQIYTQHYPANGGDVNELYNFLILAIISGKLPADKNSGIDTTRWQPAC
jgi:RHS repeat-associated protein